MYWKDKLYVMLLGSNQVDRIDQLIEDSEDYVKDDFWSDNSRRILLQHNARYGQVIIEYNPYTWKKELIFNTEQDATVFVLKVL